jgi:molybdopterin-guanine dinucleotide biosynthesis protein A
MATTSQNAEIAGVILSGGKASRMDGVCKGILTDENGQPIIAGLIKQMALAGISEVVISANDSGPYHDLGVTIIADTREGIGPLAGIEAALLHFQDRCDAVMFVPCDVPNMTDRVLRALKEAFIQSRANIVFAVTGDFFWHPLCAIVHNDLMDRISSAIDSGQTTVHRLWKQLGAEKVYFDDQSPFVNVNTVSDMNKWRKDRDE